MKNSVYKNKTLAQSHSKRLLLVGLIVFMGVFMVSFSNASWEDDLISYYKFDETSGTTATDSYGSNDLTTNATVNQVGKIGTSYNFSGQTWAIKENFPYATTGSISFWAYHDSISNGETQMVDKADGFGGLNIQVFESKVYAKVNSGDFLISTSESSVSTWYMITLTWDGTNERLYINGLNEVNGTDSASTSASVLFLGMAEGGGSKMQGKIDEVGIWDRALTPAEVIEIYNSGDGTTYTSADLTITLESPSNGTTISDIGTNFTVSGSNLSSIGANWTNLTYYIWYGNGTLHNSTFVNFADNETFNQTLFIDEFVLGDYIWNVEACWVNATTSNCSFATANYTFEVFPFSVDSISYSSQNYETNRESFILEIDTFPTIQSVTATLIYNGSEYTSDVSCLAGACTVTNNIDLPLVISGASQNNTFYWEVSVYDGSSQQNYNSTVYGQNVSRLYFERCGTYTNTTLSFSAAREDNLTAINDFSFGGIFEYWIGGGNIKRTYNYENTSTNGIDFCISPDNQTYYIDADIDYGASGFIDRTYLFYNHSIDYIQENITLLLISTTDSTTFVQEVLENKEGVEGAYIYTYRYYPGTDEWNIVQVTRTDSNGKTSGFYKAETATYKHMITVDGVTRINETNGRKMLLESVPYTITWNLDTPISVPWEIFDELTGITWSLSYNKDTGIVTFTYTGNSTYLNGNLTVWEEYYSQEDEIICTSSSDLSVASITCNVSGYDGNFIAEGRIYDGDEVILLDSIRFSSGSGSEIFGTGGVMLGWFILLVAGCAFLIHPIIGIVAINLAMIFINLFGLITFPLTFIFAIIGVSGVLIWLMKD